MDIVTQCRIRTRDRKIEFRMSDDQDPERVYLFDVDTAMTVAQAVMTAVGSIDPEAVNRHLASLNADPKQVVSQIRSVVKGKRRRKR